MDLVEYTTRHHIHMDVKLYLEMPYMLSVENIIHMGNKRHRLIEIN